MRQVCRVNIGNIMIFTSICDIKVVIIATAGRPLAWFDWPSRWPQDANATTATGAIIVSRQSSALGPITYTNKGF